MKVKIKREQGYCPICKNKEPCLKCKEFVSEWVESNKEHKLKKYKNGKIDKTAD